MKFKAIEKKYNNGYSDLIGTDRWLYSFNNYISPVSYTHLTLPTSDLV